MAAVASASASACDCNCPSNLRHEHHQGYGMRHCPEHHTNALVIHVCLASQDIVHGTQQACERSTVHHQALAVCDGCDGGGTRLVLDQRQLAKVRSRLKPWAHLAFDCRLRTLQLALCIAAC